jgi:NADH:ubiquinone oxidoreductase subunit E
MSPTLQKVLSRHPGAGREALIPLLQEAQAATGYLSREVMTEIARHLRISPAKVYGVASFYNQFRFQAPGRYVIQVCRGTACHVKGSLPLLEAVQRELRVKPGGTTKDGIFSLETVACIGVCGLAPVICIDGEFHAGVTTAKLKKILADYRKKAEAR